jgi:hypothetical protein
MKSQSILLLSLVVLSQCRPAPEPPKAMASVIPLISEGLSPHFRTVVSRLEVGGSSFTYFESDTSTDWFRSLLEQMIENLPEKERAQLPPKFSLARLFGVVGLDSVAAGGVSSRLGADGRRYSRAYLYTPEGRKGLLALTGGEAEPLLMHRHAVAGSDFAIEFPLRLKDWFVQAWDAVVEMAPATAQAQLEAGLQSKVPGSDLSLRQYLEQMDLRLAVLGRLRPDQQIPVPNSPVSVPGVDVALVIDRLGPFLPLLKQWLENLPPQIFVRQEEADVFQIQLSQATTLDYQPVLRLEGEQFILASRPVYLTELLAKDERLTDEDEFVAVWKGLPEKANGAVYLSSRFMPCVFDTMRRVLRVLPASQGDEQVKQALVGLMDKMDRSSKEAHAFAYANEADGIFAATHSRFAAPSASSLSSITAIAVVASMAMPALQMVQEQARMSKTAQRARELGSALQAHAAAHQGRYPDRLEDLWDGKPDLEPGLLTDEASGLPWLYYGETVESAPSETLLLASPLAKRVGFDRLKRVVVFRDLTTKVLLEEEFQRLVNRVRR